MLTFTTFIQHSIGSPSQSIYASKRTRRHSNLKERIKLSLFANDIRLYVENLKMPPKNKFSKVVRYKINIWKSVAFLTLTMNYQKKKLRKFHLQLHWKE